MNRKAVETIVNALRNPKHPRSKGLVQPMDDGTYAYCAVAQAFEALGGQLQTKFVENEFSTFICADRVEAATHIDDFGVRIVDLNYRYDTLPEVADQIEKDYLS